MVSPEGSSGRESGATHLHTHSHGCRQAASAARPVGPPTGCGSEGQRPSGGRPASCDLPWRALGGCFGTLRAEGPSLGHGRHHRGSQYPRAVGPPWRPPAVNILMKIYGKSNFSFLEKRNLMRIKFLISSHFSLSGCKDVSSGLGSPWLTGISLLHKGNPEVAGCSWPGPTLPLLPWGAPGIPSPSPIPAPPRLEPSRPIREGVVLEPTHKYDSAMWRLPGTLRTVLCLAGLGPQPEVPVL